MRAPSVGHSPQAARCPPPRPLPLCPTLAQAALADSGLHGPGPQPPSCPLGVTASLQSQAQASAEGQKVCAPASQSGRLALEQGKSVLTALPSGREGLVAHKPFLWAPELLGAGRGGSCSLASWPAVSLTELCGWPAAGQECVLRRWRQPRDSRRQVRPGPWGLEASLSGACSLSPCFAIGVCSALQAPPPQPAGGPAGAMALLGFLGPASPSPPRGLRCMLLPALGEQSPMGHGPA